MISPSISLAAASSNRDKLFAKHFSAWSVSESLFFSLPYCFYASFCSLRNSLSAPFSPWKLCRQIWAQTFVLLLASACNSPSIVNKKGVGRGFIIDHGLTKLSQKIYVQEGVFILLFLLPVNRICKKLSYL